MIVSLLLTSLQIDSLDHHQLATPFPFRMASRVFSGQTMRRVLVLGSGYTSAPLVEYLTRHGDISVTVGKWTGQIVACDWLSSLLLWK